MLLRRQRAPMPLPTWLFDFRKGALPAGATFSRTSGATQFNSSGTLCWAPENLLTYSQQIGGTNWTTQMGGTGSLPVVTVNDAGNLAPDGSQTASKVVFNSGGNSTASDISLLHQAIPTVIGQSYKGSVYIKGTASQQILLRHAAGNAYSLFTFTGGWDLLSVDEVAASGSGQTLDIGLRQGVNGTINSNITVWLWGAQYARNPNVSTAYIPTTSAAVYGPRFTYDPITHEPVGYLSEMASTNAITQSKAIAANYSLVAVTGVDNSTTSPDGTVNATVLTETNANSAHVALTGGLSVVASSVYAFSFFAKNITGSRWIQLNFNSSAYVNFNPSTGAVGSSSGVSSIGATQLANGWWRFSASITAGSTTTISVRTYFAQATSDGLSPSYAGDGTSQIALWGWQFESAGVGLTSYIPTAGSAASRTKDLLTLPLSSVPGWDGSKGGVLVAPYRLNTKYPASPGYNQSPVYLEGGDYNNSVHVLANYSGTNQYGGWQGSGGTIALAYGGTASAPFVRRKQAVGWQPNRTVSSVDGGSPLLTVATVALPISPATLYFGAYTTSGHSLGGTLESVAYYKGARSDEVVRRLSI